MSVSNFLEFPATRLSIVVVAAVVDRQAQLLIGIAIAGRRMTYAAD